MPGPCRRKFDEKGVEIQPTVVSDSVVRKGYLTSGMWPCCLGAVATYTLYYKVWLVSYLSQGSSVWLTTTLLLASPCGFDSRGQKRFSSGRRAAGADQDNTEWQSAGHGYCTP
jgi:hypothetical protein